MKKEQTVKVGQGLSEKAAIICDHNVLAARNFLLIYDMVWVWPFQMSFYTYMLVKCKLYREAKADGLANYVFSLISGYHSFVECPIVCIDDGWR